VATTGGGEVRLNARATLRVGLVWAMGLLLFAYVAGLLLQGGVSHPIVDFWLSLVTSWLPAVVCWVVVAGVGLRRWDILLAAVGMTLLAAGDTYYAPLTSTWSPPFPSPGDIGYLLFYPLMLAALVVVVRRGARELASSVWLDCAVGSLGAASVLAVMLSPVLESAMGDSLSLATVVSVAYPMFDLLLVAAVTGIAALGAIKGSGRLVLLILGLLAYTSADVIYALEANSDSYTIGTPLDAVWAIGLTLIALWVNDVGQPHRPRAHRTREATGLAPLVVSSAATAAGLAVLVVSSRVHLSTLAVALAGATMLAAAARALLSFRQLAWMADLRRIAATTDDLTGLPNRRAMYAEGHARLVEPQKRRQALLMMDLNKFKDVNDSLGHHTGDLLLIAVSARLLERLREGDVLARLGSDVLARLGGDEFAVLLEDAGKDDALEVAKKLRAALAEPFILGEVTLHISVSIGIALFPDDGPDLSSLLRKADIAMYRAKTSGTGYHVYRSVDDAEDATRLQTVEELRTAMTTDQLVVHYQPKVDLDTGEVHGVEALVRWDHPTRGLLYPEAFLNLVEESGLMPSLTQVVLSQALDQVATWHAHGQQLTVAVNLSGSCLGNANLPGTIASMLADRDLRLGALQLEITEEFLMADRDGARAILNRLRQTGVQISIDDFGTGYSSLSYLRDLPIDELKLDRSFIFPMADDARAAALVASTIALAHSLGLRMVAEGVETDVAYTELARLGCDQAQGYYMSRPVPAVELDHWLRNRIVMRPAGNPQPLPATADG
jgi:diguanylate cyclase (GGDEF)-like protein